MKRNLTTLAIVLLGLSVAAPAVRADGPGWGLSIGFGPRGPRVEAHVGFPAPPPRHRDGFRRVIVERPPRVVHVHHRMPIYQQVWVPARYEQVFVGYGCFGFPIYRTVCVSPGHFETVLVGYRCGGCSCPL